MKLHFAVFAAAVLLSVQVFAKAKTIVDCRVATIVDSNVFEESLSKEEYPEVYVEADETTGRLVSASVGVNIDYEVKNGDTVARLSAQNSRNQYVLRYKNSSMTVLLQVHQYQGPRPNVVWGNLLVSENGESAREIAILVCKK